MSVFYMYILYYVHCALCTLYKVIFNTEYRRQQEAEFAFNVCNYRNVVSLYFELIANVNIERPNVERMEKESKWSDRDKDRYLKQDAYRHINRFDMNQDCGNPFITFCFVFCVLCAYCMYMFNV